MSEHEQRVAIAEWMGWLRIKDFSQGLMMPPGTSVCGYPPSGALIGKPIELPDYTRDLNAMHEAEKRLKGEQHGGNERLRFYWMLAQVVAPMIVADQIGFLFIHATAAQRAEALLRTLGLWKEATP